MEGWTNGTPYTWAIGLIWNCSNSLVISGSIVGLLLLGVSGRGLAIAVWPADPPPTCEREKVWSIKLVSIHLHMLSSVCHDSERFSSYLESPLQYVRSHPWLHRELDQTVSQHREVEWMGLVGSQQKVVLAIVSALSRARSWHSKNNWRQFGCLE